MATAGKTPLLRSACTASARDTAATIGNAPTQSIKPAAVDNAAIDALLKRGRRWRMTAEVQPALPLPPPAIIVQPQQVTWELGLRKAGPFAISFFASIATHLIVLLVAAFIAAGTARSPVPLFVVDGAMLSDAEEMVELVIPLAESTGAARADDEATAATFTSIELDPGVMHGGSPEVILADISEGAVGNVLFDVAGLSKDLGNGKSSAGTGDEGSGGATEGDQGTDFFGVQATGKRFVFVCDCSRSMTGMKWAELNRELIRCIGELKAGQSFYVIFFDGEMHAMFEPFDREPTLLDATAQNIDKAQYWIANVSLGRNTSPFESMKFGIGLEPETMFLLTDGEFSDYTAPYLRDFNKKRHAQGKQKVVIHTIGFFSQKHQLVLERIAKDSGGTYKFVEGPQSVKPKRRSWNVVAPPPGMPNLNFGPGLPFRPGVAQGGN